MAAGRTTNASTILDCCLQVIENKTIYSALREILQRVLRAAIHSNFEMQLWLVAIITSHFGNLAAGSHLLAFTDQAFAVVCISAEHSIAVLDNDQFAVPQQSITAIHHLAVRRGNYRLAWPAPDINALSGRVIGLEPTDHSAVSRPHPV